MNTDASYQIRCDACSAKLGENYMSSSSDNLSIPLKDKDGNSKTHHFCDEACLTAKLNQRASKRIVKTSSTASLNIDIANKKIDKEQN